MQEENNDIFSSSAIYEEDTENKKGKGIMEVCETRAYACPCEADHDSFVVFLCVFRRYERERVRRGGSMRIRKEIHSCISPSGFLLIGRKKKNSGEVII